MEKYAQAGIGGITVWRQALGGLDPEVAGRMIRAQGMDVVSLCRGGFFASTDSHKRQMAIEDNLRALDEAAGLGAPLLVLVCGADPKQSMDTSRKQIAEGIAAILPHAEAYQIRLGIEPLHPMYADDRSAINTLKQGTNIAMTLGSPWVGVVVDAYHLWWDPDLEAQIYHCGKEGKLFAFHISDWKTPTTDILNDRGLMGEGCIALRRIRTWIMNAGFEGFHEVEIFSQLYWQMDQDLFLSKIVNAYNQYLCG